MGAVSLSWDGLGIADLSLAGGKASAERVEFQVRKITISPVISSLFGDTTRLHGITLDHPEVIFIDGENKSSSKSSSALDPEGMGIEIENIFLLEGKFTYIRNVKKTHAVLIIHGITGDIDPDPAGASARVNAQIGGQGSIELRVLSPYAKKPLEVDTEIQVLDQDLVALSEFFKPNAGVELTGVLTNGHAYGKMRGSHLTSSLRAEYKDFKLRVDKMYDRNDAQTFFTNLGAAIAMRSKNKSLTQDRKTAAVELNRDGGESLVSFILRGLKEAALKVALKWQIGFAEVGPFSVEKRIDILNLRDGIANIFFLPLIGAGECHDPCGSRRIFQQLDELLRIFTLINHI